MELYNYAVVDIIGNISKGKLTLIFFDLINKFFLIVHSA